MPTAPVRLTEILAALSLATDLATGAPPDKALRVCLAACALGEALELDRDDQADLHQAALLRAIGCTAHAAENADAFDDDLALQRDMHALDVADPASIGSFGAWAGEERAAVLRERLHEILPTTGPQAARFGCEASQALGRALTLRPGAIAALDEVYERWDGRGIPDGRAGDELTIAARATHVAEQFVIATDAGGPDWAVEQLRRRAGGHLDPAMAEAARRACRELAAATAAPDPLAAVLDAEPPAVRFVMPDEVDRALEALADFVDLKSRYTLGHSRGVAELAARAAGLAGVDEDAVREIHRAGLVHDVGRASVSTATWERVGDLTPGERDRVRLHTYWTERVLARAPATAGLARPASSHHERLDGSGYHRGIAASGIDRCARFLAAADALHAMREPRPHRPALSLDDAARELEADASAGRFDRAAVGAVLEAEGVRPQRTSLPNGLTEREVEVLCLLARGMTNRQIADELVVSPRTVQHHVSHVFDKLGRRTRAGAAVFAMEHGLVAGVE